MDQLDEKDTALRAAMVAQRDALEGPRVGDFVVFDRGFTGRFSYDWGDRIQWSTGGSFALCSNGGISFSGGLYQSLLKDKLTLMDEVREGNCWFFSHGWARAHGGVDTTIPCRVYRYDGERPRT